MTNERIPVDLVVAIDSSRSMRDKAQQLSRDAEQAIKAAATSCPSNLRVQYLGVEGRFAGTNFQRTIRDYLVNECNVTKDDLRGLKKGDKNKRAPSEDGAGAITDIATHFDWRKGAKRAILYLSDEALDGSSHNKKPTEHATKEANHAIRTARRRRVAVHTYFAAPFDATNQDLVDLQAEFARVASKANGKSFTTVDTLDGFVDVLKSVICASKHAEFPQPDEATPSKTPKSPSKPKPPKTPAKQKTTRPSKPPVSPKSPARPPTSKTPIVSSGSGKPTPPKTPVKPKTATSTKPPASPKSPKTSHVPIVSSGAHKPTPPKTATSSKPPASPKSTTGPKTSAATNSGGAGSGCGPRYLWLLSIPILLLTVYFLRPTIFGGPDSTPEPDTTTVVVDADETPESTGNNDADETPESPDTAGVPSATSEAIAVLALPEPRSCAESAHFNVLFIVDNSSSIDAEEFAAFSDTIQDVGELILATNSIAQVGVIHYGGIETEEHATFGRNIAVEREFSRDAIAPPTRVFATEAYPEHFMDNMAGAMEEILMLVDDDNSTESEYQVSGPTDMNHTLGDAGHIVIFTDAAWDYLGSSSIIDADGPANDWDVYDRFKNRNWRISLIRIGTPEDADKAAAIASEGGSYDGEVATNEHDPEGVGTTPRLYYSPTSFDFSDIASDIIIEVNDLCPDSVIEPLPTGIVGRVVDATTGEPLSAAEVCVQGSGQCVAVGANGEYAIDDVPAGEQAIVVSAADYFAVERLAEVADGKILTQNFALSPEIEAGEFRIVLSWEATPQDLDSHLFIPTEDEQRLRLYFRTRAETAHQAFATLDTDAREGVGPETITIPERTSGTYSYMVHIYSDDSTSFAGAIVQVYDSNGLVQTFAGPTDEGVREWHVFDIDGDTDELIVIDELGAGQRISNSLLVNP